MSGLFLKGSLKKVSPDQQNTEAPTGEGSPNGKEDENNKSQKDASLGNSAGTTTIIKEKI